jgi:hypothetical protein
MTLNDKRASLIRTEVYRELNKLEAQIKALKKSVATNAMSEDPRFFKLCLLETRSSISGVIDRVNYIEVLNQ